jgi:hypothetical protein
MISRQAAESTFAPRPEVAVSLGGVYHGRLRSAVTSFRRLPWPAQGAIAAAAAYSLVHLVVSGVVQPLRSDNVGQVIEELQPLYRLFTAGEATVDQPRQYGPVFLALFQPVYRYTLSRPDLLAWYGYALDLLAIGIAFVATRRAIATWASRRGLTLPRATTPALLFLWMNFSPLYGVLAIKNVELWELALMAVAGAAVLERRRWVVAWSIAAAALVKMLPLVFVPYLLLRDRRTFAYTVIAIGVLVSLAQALYGYQMGWGYLPMIVNAALGGEGYGNAGGLLWHENVSIRGLAFKMFGYLEAPGSNLAANYQVGYFAIVPGELRPMAWLVAMVAQGAAVAWLGWQLVMRKWADDAERMYFEWALVAIMMLMLAPQISQDYMVLALGAFSYVLAACLLRADGWLWAQYIAAVLLVANVVPRGLFARLVFADVGARAAGYQHLTVAEAYQYFGFPLIGLVLLLRVWSRVSRVEPER